MDAMATSEEEPVPCEKARLFNGRFLIIGFGLVGQSSLTIILKTVGLHPRDVTIIAADDNGKPVADQVGVTHINRPLTRDNYREILDEFLRPGDFLLNVSVDVSSLALIDYCQEKGCLYMDSCIEPWKGGYEDDTLTLGERSNYALREKAMALKRKYVHGPTALVACGANPGMVSFLVKQALVNLAHDTQMQDFVVPVSKDGWAMLASRLGVKTIHIAERDTQVSCRPKKRGEFINTWSVDGFISEAVHQPAELGWGTHERVLPADGRTHKEGCGAAIYLERPGGTTQVRTWTPQEGPFHGFLVTHNEAISISDYYTVRDATDPSAVLYRPTCHYAYHPCDAAVMSLREMLGHNNQEPRVKHIATPEEVQHGDDELGVLLMGHARGAYWFGSRVSIEEARRVAPYNTATSLQISAGVLAGVMHVLRNPREGVIESDEMDHVAALEVALPYLGTVEGVYTDWTPLKNRSTGFPFVGDLNDPWQFSNFRVM